MHVTVTVAELEIGKSEPCALITKSDCWIHYRARLEKMDEIVLRLVLLFFYYYVSQFAN